jgi:dihydrofolate reductase
VIVLSNQRANEPAPLALKGKVQFSNLTPKHLIEQLDEQKVHRVYLDGGQLIQSFLRENLVTDMVITTVPVLLGSGRPLFGAMPQDADFKLLSSRSFPSGLVQSHYLLA